MIPLGDPTGTQPLLNAARWVEDTLLGSTAITVATLGVAALGLLMLNGRVPFRRAAVVVVGCFVLLGAATLARGIMGIINSNHDGQALALATDADVPAPASPPLPAPSQVYDPSAGAAVPVR